MTPELEQQFEQVYLQYSPILKNFIHNSVLDWHKAEDLLQDVFLKAWRYFDRYDSTKSKMSTWLMNITIQTIAIEKRNYATRMRIASMTNIDEYLDIVAPEGKLDELFDVQSVLATLPPLHLRQLIMASQGYLDSEIARITKQNYDSTQNRIRSTRKQIQKLVT
jgi:RNA polymerase sigma factor (sigma-70 family)